MYAETSLRHPSESASRARSAGRSPLRRLHWLLVAVGLCWLSWPAPAEAQPGCTHGLCELGGKLSEVCDPCVDAICNDPQNPGNIYCCTVEWDQTCIDSVLEVCLNPICAQVCDHNPCEVGGALDSTCNACTAQVCFEDPSCCTDDGDPLTDDWDASCVNLVQQLCGMQCEPGTDICCCANNSCLPGVECPPVTPIHKGLISGTLLGSTNDGCSSDGDGHSVGCRSGDVWYSYTQGEADDMLLSTCTTQRSYAIDSVLSVHTECPGKRNNEIIGNDDWDLGLTQACELFSDPKNVDAALPLAGVYALDPGQTVVIRVSHHDDSFANNFTLRILPEPGAWLALVAGAGVLGALSRRRARD